MQSTKDTRVMSVLTLSCVWLCLLCVWGVGRCPGLGKGAGKRLLLHSLRYPLAQK